MMQNEANNIFGNLKAIDIFHVAGIAIKNMRKLQHLDIILELETNFNKKKITRVTKKLKIEQRVENTKHNN